MLQYLLNEIIFCKWERKRLIRSMLRQNDLIVKKKDDFVVNVPRMVRIGHP